MSNYATVHTASNNEDEQNASHYHAMATVADLLATLKRDSQKNQYKKELQQYTYMEFVDKKTGEVSAQRVLF